MLKYILEGTAQFSAPARSMFKGKIHPEAVHILLLVHGLGESYSKNQDCNVDHRLQLSTLVFVHNWCCPLQGLTKHGALKFRCQVCFPLCFLSFGHFPQLRWKPESVQTTSHL